CRGCRRLGWHRGLAPTGPPCPPTSQPGRAASRRWRRSGRGCRSASCSCGGGAETSGASSSASRTAPPRPRRPPPPPPPRSARAAAVAAGGWRPVQVFPLLGNSTAGLHQHEGTILWDAITVCRKGHAATPVLEEPLVSDRQIRAATSHARGWAERLAACETV